MALVSIKLLQAAFEPKHTATALDKWPQPQRHNQASDSQSFTTEKKKKKKKGLELGPCGLYGFAQASEADPQTKESASWND